MTESALTGKEDAMRPMARNRKDSPMKLLVLGGCRSGKSRYAEERVAANFTDRVYVATLEDLGDGEMARRIALHRESRERGWRTLEEPLAIGRLLAGHDGSAEVFLVDCLTMWITNMLMRDFTDGKIEAEVFGLVRTVERLASSVVLVANEVGLGLVPDTALGRRFRDLAGWTNQQLAQVCPEVVFVAAGLPLRLKG
ncbi:bifunctional adenosylcobinamide kinase/adenosylcobinamide-phosphate guanylyltransferase [Thiovibrio sp. JS02]